MITGMIIIMIMAHMAPNITKDPLLSRSLPPCQ